VKSAFADCADTIVPQHDHRPRAVSPLPREARGGAGEGAGRGRADASLDAPAPSSESAKADFGPLLP